MAIAPLIADASSTPSGAPLAENVATGLLVIVGIYFLPTIVAASRHRGAAWPTFWMNLFCGWTVVGWLIAWLVAFRDHRPAVVVVNPPPLVLPEADLVVAPDGRHWWSGFAWLDAEEYAPAWALRSPDGTSWWTGSRWIPPAMASESAALGPESPWWERLPPPAPDGVC